jgi:ABC-type transporter lipoprotein component MlaA
MTKSEKVAYDVSFASVVADMIQVRLELKEDNIEEAMNILNKSINKNQEAAMEVFEDFEQ